MPTASKLSGRLPAFNGVRFTLDIVRGMHRELIFPAGWGLAALTHYVHGRTTFHVNNAYCKCEGKVMPRIESFHFAMRDADHKPTIVRLGTHATTMLYEQTDSGIKLVANSRVRIVRDHDSKRARQHATMLGPFDGPISHGFDLSRERLAEELSRIFEIAPAMTRSVFS